jgi:hypothetical protein
MTNQNNKNTCKEAFDSINTSDLQNKRIEYEVRAIYTGRKPKLSVANYLAYKNNLTPI